MATHQADTHHSSLREGMLEHLFVGELMRMAWLRNWIDFDVLRPVTAAAGYDVVMSADGATRHIQLKSSAVGATTKSQKINMALSRQPAGCVVWMFFDPKTIRFDHFHWFGGTRHEALPDLGDRIAKHTKTNAAGTKNPRANLRVLAKGKFTYLADVDAVFERLFQGEV